MAGQQHGRHRRSRRPTALWSHVVDRFGWRAYAVPALSLATLIVLLVSDASSRHRGAKPNAHTPRTQSHGSAASALRVDPTPSATATRTTPNTNPCRHNAAAQLIRVSISKQRAWMCAGTKQVHSSPVTTGAAGNDTPIGTWQVQAKEQDRWLSGPDYVEFVKYWVPYNGDFGFHDAAWQKLPYGSAGYRTHGSHGCVHLPGAAMSWLYDWVTVGATVRVDA